MALLKQAQKKQEYKKGEAELSYELHNSALASYVVMYQSSAPPTTRSPLGSSILVVKYKGSCLHHGGGSPSLTSAL